MKNEDFTPMFFQAHDPAAQAYAQKFQTLLSTELKDWHGVWAMKTKLRF